MQESVKVGKGIGKNRIIKSNRYFDKNAIVIMERIKKVYGPKNNLKPGTIISIEKLI